MLSYTDPAVTVDEANAYFLASHDSDWATGTGDKKAALIRGQRYIAGRYNERWNVEFDDASAPEPVKYAIIEAARRELVNPGSLTPDFIAATVIKREKVKAGPVETETEFVGGGSAEASLPVITTIDRLLAGLLRSVSQTTSVSMLMRA